MRELIRLDRTKARNSGTKRRYREIKRGINGGTGYIKGAGKTDEDEKIQGMAVIQY